MSQTFEEKREIAAKRLGISAQSIPKHIAIIMDGNGRWATNRGLVRFKGHEQGGRAVEDIVQYCVDIGVECLSLYSFSMQNWKRPQEEIDFLMYLYVAYLEGIRPNLMRNCIRLAHLGHEAGLPDDVVGALHDTIDITSKNDGMVLGLALNYGSRTEIVDAVKQIANKCISGELKVEDIDHECMSNHMYTAGLRDPDLVIRTSGELRLSNFLLWQVSYAEFYVTETLWPDFDKSSVDEALKAYAQRARRFGDIKSSSTS